MNLIPENVEINGDANLNVKIDQQSTVNLVIASTCIILFYFLVKKVTK